MRWVFSLRWIMSHGEENIKHTEHKRIYKPKTSDSLSNPRQRENGENSSESRWWNYELEVKMNVSRHGKENHLQFLYFQFCFRNDVEIMSTDCLPITADPNLLMGETLEIKSVWWLSLADQVLKLSNGLAAWIEEQNNPTTRLAVTTFTRYGELSSEIKMHRQGTFHYPFGVLLEQIVRI